MTRATQPGKSYMVSFPNTLKVMLSFLLFFCDVWAQGRQEMPGHTFALRKSQHQKFHGWREITGCWCCSGQFFRCPHAQRKTSLLLTSNSLSICFSFTPVLKLITALIFRNHFAFKPKKPHPDKSHSSTSAATGGTHHAQELKSRGTEGHTPLVRMDLISP